MKYVRAIIVDVAIVAIAIILTVEHYGMYL